MKQSQLLQSPDNIAQQIQRLYQEKRFSDGAALCHDLLTQDPENPEHLNNLAVMLNAAGRSKEALKCYQQLLQLAPQNAGVVYNLANTLLNACRYEEAAGYYRQALSLDPQFAAAHNNLGRCYEAQQQPEQAYRCYQQALVLDPGMPAIHNNLGNLQKKASCPEKALRHYQQALVLQPNYLEALSNCGVVLNALGRYDEALRFYRRALALNPEHSATNWNLSLALLQQGNFIEGLTRYESRLHQADTPATPWLPVRPRWQGKPFNGRLLVYEEQGFGDVIQFLRFLPLAKARGGKIYFSVSSAMLRLCSNVAGVDRLLEHSPHQPLLTGGEFDLMIPLLSLPHLLGVTLTTLPPFQPYLHSSEDLLQSWQARLAPAPRRIGLVWAGNPKHPNDSRRSCRLADMAPLATVGNTVFYSLQKDAPTNQSSATSVRLPLVDLTGDLDDFAATAAMIAQLDLVITVDTAVAHLAGALGRPTWVALPLVAEWRWLLDRSDSPWYPTMKLFRQTAADDWRTVFARMAAELNSSPNTAKEAKQ
ncbi:MAG TPA: tetratricopeptide repeat-containing glycosyltransferase family protein [Patescibacteria group bacterium]|nr:tetratricopeptide repeat-containing glycosyltransferase family protein [Patescibacteria group bacterium]